jgi:superfamily II DNA or RNA helicase
MLRDYQRDLKGQIYAAWQDAATRNVMSVAPTGSGKTVVLGSILQELQRPACAVAHRQELVGQLALALNREEVPHGIT